MIDMDSVFLIIDGVEIEDLEKDGYRAYEKDLSAFLRMAEGNLVCEEQGSYWCIELNTATLPEGMLAQLDQVLRSSKKHVVAFLPPDGGTEIITSEFFLTSGLAPSLTSWGSEFPEWSNFSLKLEEVNPHD